MKIAQANLLPSFAGREGGRVIHQELTMFKSRSICVTTVGLGGVFFLGSLLTLGLMTRMIVGVSAQPARGPSQSESTAPSSIPASSLINTQDLAKILQSPPKERPLLIHVGFRLPYTQGHIPASEYFGPAVNPTVVQQLRTHVEGLPRNKFIVIYCGCCPWSHCPNIRPAYEALHSLGFTKLKALYIPDNLGTDWVNKGYPIEKGE